MVLVVVPAVSDSRRLKRLFLVCRGFSVAAALRGKTRALLLLLLLLLVEDEGEGIYQPRHVRRWKEKGD